MSNRVIEIQNKLHRATTVEELIENLKDMDPTALVVFACNYGDYHNTQQTLCVGDVEELTYADLRTTAYSHSGVALAGDRDDEDMPEVEGGDQPIVVLS